MTYTKQVTLVRVAKGAEFSTLAFEPGDNTRLVLRQVAPKDQDAAIREGMEAGNRVTIHAPNGPRMVWDPLTGWRSFPTARLAPYVRKTRAN